MKFTAGVWEEIGDREITIGKAIGDREITSYAEITYRKFVKIYVNYKVQIEI